MKHIVFFSSGIGSWAAAQRVAKEHGTRNLILLFADTLHEDEDNYRFLFEAAAQIYGIDCFCPPDFSVPHIRDMEERKKVLQYWFDQFALLCPGLVRVCDGRSIFELWDDHRAIASDRLPFCTMELKQNASREWLSSHEQNKGVVEWHRQLRMRRPRCPYPKPDTEGSFRLYIGFDWSEPHRLDGVEQAWHPWQVCAPMMDVPYIDKRQMLQQVIEVGLRPPRLYDDPRRAHANCGGACARNGIKAWTLTLLTAPDVYAAWEEAEQKFNEGRSREYSMLRDRTGQTKGQKARPLTLKKLRERTEARIASGQAAEASAEDASCSCFAISEGL